MGPMQYHRDNSSIELGSDVFKALASENRIKILLLLDKRPMTVTRISKELKISKATAYEHLKKLTESNLVRKKESENIWVYYELTKKGQALFSNNSLLRLRIALISTLTLEFVAIGSFTNILTRPTMGSPPLGLQVLIITLSILLFFLFISLYWVKSRSPMNQFKVSLARS